MKATLKRPMVATHYKIVRRNKKKWRQGGDMALEGLRGQGPALSEILDCFTIISELFACLDRVGFELHDVASISSRRCDGRARQGDFVFVRRSSPLVAEAA
ncbi:MAG: hypothetical protein AAGH68_15615 [Pseudomonadota bacterium]